MLKTKFVVIILLILILLVFGVHANAQTKFTLSGQILDSKTNEPLPYANISIPQSLSGVISNEKGEFQYHIPENFENSEILITYIGYKTVKINISETETGKLTIIRMEPLFQQLQEVKVAGNKSKTEAVDIVNKAIKNIRKNYPKEKTLYYGYYRDYIRPAWTDSCKNLFEAALVIEDRGFHLSDFERTKIKLEQLRYNPAISVDSSLNQAYDVKSKFIPYMGLAAANELSILRAHDPNRNHKIMTFSYVDILDYKFTPNHNFHYESITEQDSVRIYCIRFDKHTKDSSAKTEYWADGKIYISSESFAILKFSYSVSCNTPTYTGVLFELNLEYKNYHAKYYLSYLSLMNYFLSYNSANQNYAGTPLPYFQYRELFINKVENAPFEPIQTFEEIKKNTSLLTNKIPVNEGFWEKYNYPGSMKLLE
jgi:hypothetical protein